MLGRENRFDTNPVLEIRENLRISGFSTILQPYALVGEDGKRAGTAWKAIALPTYEEAMRLDQINAKLKEDYERNREQNLRAGLPDTRFVAFERLEWQHIAKDDRVCYGLTALEALQEAARVAFA